MKIVTSSQMKELDRRTIQEARISEKTLIDSAGKSTANWIAARFTPKSREIWALAGPGHNGADALVAAKYLKARNNVVKIFKLWEKTSLKDFQRQFARIPCPESRLLLIDGIFGIGLNGPLKEPYRSLIRMIRSSRVEVISLDIPSGLHPDSGIPQGDSIRAKYTLTFGLPKLGLVQEHAADDVGELHVLDIGFPKKFVEEIQTPYDLIDFESVSSLFNPRSRSAHKGDFGRVLVIGGSVGFVGAPVLAAQAALRAGAGLVHLAVPSSVYSIAAILAGPEIMVTPCQDSGSGHFKRNSNSSIKSLLRTVTAIVVGPGIGQHPETRYFLETLLASVSVPLVLDADGLNLISNNPSILNRAGCKIMITPHPGEMGRLVRQNIEKIQKDRFEISGNFAKKQQVTVILKGARTVIAHPQAIASRTSKFHYSVNALAGNPGMAMGGCGDVLSGILGALLARGFSMENAARCGVLIHTRAGDLALPETGGGIARDLIAMLPDAHLSICN